MACRDIWTMALRGDRPQIGGDFCLPHRTVRISSGNRWARPNSEPPVWTDHLSGSPLRKIVGMFAASQSSPNHPCIFRGSQTARMASPLSIMMAVFLSARAGSSGFSVGSRRCQTTAACRGFAKRRTAAWACRPDARKHGGERAVMGRAAATSLLGLLPTESGDDSSLRQGAKQIGSHSANLSTPKEYVPPAGILVIWVCALPFPQAWYVYAIPTSLGIPVESYMGLPLVVLI